MEIERGRRPICALFGGVVVFAMVLMACGTPATSTSAPANSPSSILAPLPPDEAPSDPGIGLGMDWSGAQNGMPVTSTDEAGQYLLFSPPYNPRGLGETRALYVSKEPVRAAKTTLTFVYDSGSYGRVLVIMMIDQLSAAQRHASDVQWVSYNDKPGFRGHTEIVTFRDGIEARVTTFSTTGASAVWREGPILVGVAGPTLTRDQVIAIGEGL